MFGYTLIALLAFMSAGLWLMAYLEDGCFGQWAFPAVIFSFILTIAVVVVPMTQADYHATIAGHQEVGETLERARVNDFDGYERATLQREVVQSNKEIRKYQTYYKYWKPYIPGAILDVEMIE